MKLWQKVIAIVTGISAIIGVIIAMVWGVPHYIDNRVNAKVDERLNKLQLNPESYPAFARLEQKVDSIDSKVTGVDTKVDRVESKVDDFGVQFMGYLERQAQ